MRCRTGLDSGEPFWISHAVTSTSTAIWRNSLSRFWNVASANAPLVTYSAYDSGGWPCSWLSWLLARWPVTLWPIR